jgi:hypothetical protein
MKRLLFAVIPTVCIAAAGPAQDLAELLEKSRCTMPVYFPVETYYAGRIWRDKSRIKIDIRDLMTTRERDDFLKKGAKARNEAFLKAETIHEFGTTGELPFGESASDVYKGLEKAGDRYYFKVRGVGEELSKVKLNYRSVPPHGLVVIQEINAVEYFNRVLKNAIAPALARCR